MPHTASIGLTCKGLSSENRGGSASARQSPCRLLFADTGDLWPRWIPSVFGRLASQTGCGIAPKIDAAAVQAATTIGAVAEVADRADSEETTLMKKRVNSLRRKRWFKNTLLARTSLTRLAR